jgi:hypothetical protein
MGLQGGSSEGRDSHGRNDALKVDCAEGPRRLIVATDDGQALSVTVRKDERLPVTEYRNTVDINPAADNSFAVGAVAAEYTLPTPGGRYILTATGGTVWIRETIAATVNGPGMVCPDGVPSPVPIRIMGPTVSCIAAAANRVLYFVEVLD